MVLAIEVVPMCGPDFECPSVTGGIAMCDVCGTATLCEIDDRLCCVRDVCVCA